MKLLMDIWVRKWKASNFYAEVMKALICSIFLQIMNYLTKNISSQLIIETINKVKALDYKIHKYEVVHYIM